MTARIEGLRDSRWTLRVVLLVLAVALISVAGLRYGSGAADAKDKYNVPEDSKMESSLGIRFISAQVVGDGGLVELRYNVLDNERASKFQNDTHHPPVLYSDHDRKNPVYRTALMKQGHDLRPGQTYFILYQNNKGAVRSGDTIEIDAGGGKLQHVPVR